MNWRHSVAIHYHKTHCKCKHDWAVVVAQMVERKLPTPDVSASNPVIGKLFTTDLLSTVLKRRNKRKRGRDGPNLKNANTMEPNIKRSLIHRFRVVVQQRVHGQRRRRREAVANLIMALRS